MKRRIGYALSVGIMLSLLQVVNANGSGDLDGLKLNQGDHVCYIGNTLADRMQHHGWLETYIHALHPRLQLTVRNLGFPGDELTNRPRSANFGSADQWLAKCTADVIFCFFGYNEAIRGAESADRFSADLATTIDSMRGQKYNGSTAPRLVVFSPIAHEDLHNPNLPDGSANNELLARLTEGARRVCAEKNVLFVDLFRLTQELYSQSDQAMTLNGIHLLDHGNRMVARSVIKQLFPGRQLPESSRVNTIRDAVLEKNDYWFSRYRVVDGYNVYGGRSKLAWHGQSNADVMRREMEILDVMTQNRDRRLWAVVEGREGKFDDGNLPPELEVVTNKKGPLEGGAFPYLGGREAISKMTVAEGMEVNLFASEERFPRLVNPVQMAVDTDSRLWASVWQSYPHWNPTEPRKDALVILPDENGDGEADDCIVFADQLNSVTGFEFWGGGVLVAAPPEIWFLKDSDGDDKADVKIRMLQGVSSADTHHSANAMVVGPDGWLYWSRGIFNVTNMETPTKSFRSKNSGVHRFNPRTFETEFHFPIGPNPHGDVFDQWGFQFANDGTGGTGCYVNIGKGIGNKVWFKKRWRPVAATGILSSSHFPPANNGTFLICNTIGFLGVLQHKVEYDGADIHATAIEPIVVSTDPNFRPVDVENGGDGALYIADWHNTLIGHMQHNMRDPNRDHIHGRVYRVTCTGRPLLTPPKMKNKPIAEVCQHFFAKENGTRYRARLELSGRPTAAAVEAVDAFARQLDPRKVEKDRDEAQALLECLWIFEEHRVPNMELLNRVFLAAEPRVRAAAIRTLGHWAGRVEGWEPALMAAARDPEALVRAEAVKAAVGFSGVTPTEAIFEVATRTLDPELEAVIKYAKSKINVDALVRDALDKGRELSPAAQAYVLQNAAVDDLLKLKQSEVVYRAILGRSEASVDQLSDALHGLAKASKSDSVDLLMQLIAEARQQPNGNVLGLGNVLVRFSPTQLFRVRDQISQLATHGESAEVKHVGYAAWVAAAGPGDAFLAAARSKDRLRDFLDAVPTMAPAVRSQLYDKVEPLISEMPANLSSERGGSSLRQPGIAVDYFYPSGRDVARETLAILEPVASGVVPEISMDVPQRAEKDRFALRFSGTLQVPKTGKYTFFANSDDGSRVYVDDQLIVNNDGLHGMSEKSGAIDLLGGSHALLVTYFDNGGGDGLAVSWNGPGMKKQKIDGKYLALGGGETLHDVAIHALASIPGQDERKFKALGALIAAGRHRPSAIAAMRGVDSSGWIAAEVPQLVDNLVGYLSEMPARYRTGGPALDAVGLAKSLADTLPDSKKRDVLSRLQNLDVRVIAIGTVAHRMIFDKERIAVQAGRTVEFRFSNTDAMPHNFAITLPGALEEVGELGEATGRDADAEARNYIPKSDKILIASRLLQPSENQALSFEVPDEPGVYPFVCTYPGHWRRMYGALYVVPDLEGYQADEASYLAANPLPIQDDLLKLNTRRHEWTFDELIPEVKNLPAGRSYEVGRELFKVANCVGCHQLQNEGRVFGPDLAKLEKEKYSTEYILRSLVEPSKDINEKYQSQNFIMDTGRIITGMVLEETEEEVQIVIDPLAKDKPTILNKSEIDDRDKSDTSLMPKGLLDKLSREEILDLVAYVYARGDKAHVLFADDMHNHMSE